MGFPCFTSVPHDVGAPHLGHILGAVRAPLRSSPGTKREVGGGVTFTLTAATVLSDETN